MASKRRKLASRQVGLSARAIEAWRIGDFHGLNRALAIRPWQASPFPTRLTALGVDQGSYPIAQSGHPAWHDLNCYGRAQELQRALIEAAGEPPAQLKEVT
jgi:hypothetical protein